MTGTVEAPGIVNRILVAIEKMQGTISGPMPALQAKARMTFAEYCQFQDDKSLAVAYGIITLEESQTIYSELGRTPEQFNARPLAVRLALLEKAKELRILFKEGLPT